MTPTQRSPAPRGARQGGRQLGGCRRRDLVQSSPPCLAAHARDFEPITQHNERFTVELTHELYEEWEITAACEHQRRQCVAGLPSASSSTTGATAGCSWSTPAAAISCAPSGPLGQMSYSYLAPLSNPLVPALDNGDSGPAW